MQAAHTVQTADEIATPSKPCKLPDSQVKGRSTMIGNSAKGPAAKIFGNLADILGGGTLKHPLIIASFLVLTMG